MLRCGKENKWISADPNQEKKQVSNQESVLLLTVSIEGKRFTERRNVIAKGCW